MKRIFNSRVFLGLALVFLAMPACRVTDMPLWRPAKPPPAADSLVVKKIENIAYFEGKDADDYRHRLDLFLPQGKKDFPVVVLVHGGSWMMGDNRCCGLYSSVGEFLASRGIGAVLPNFRLSPAVKHPEHMKDLARAVAWTKANIAKHGGRPDQIFLVGHSAGGHMVALLATDDKYLKAEGLKSADIKGVVALSGVYRIPQGDYEFNLFGSGKDGLPGLPAMAEEFREALLAKGSACKLYKVEARNHNSIMFRAIDLEDSVGKGIVEFIQSSTAPNPFDP